MDMRRRVFLIFGEGEFIKLVETLRIHDPDIKWPGRSATVGGANPIFMSNTVKDSHTGPVGVLSQVTRDRIRNQNGTLVMINREGQMALLSNRENATTGESYKVGDQFSWEFKAIESSEAILDKPFRSTRLRQLAERLK